MLTTSSVIAWVLTKATYMSSSWFPDAITVLTPCCALDLIDEPRERTPPSAPQPPQPPQPAHGFIIDI
ncbi:hypothetical protein M0804_012915 [Polistes exclamans]|nr:hypothetical protein M0804_012915 [Polistes exclamans]